MTLQEIINLNQDRVNYIVQQTGNTNASLRYLVNSFNETSVVLQKINTMKFFTFPLTTQGYEVFIPLPEDPLQPYKDIVLNAIEFFNDIMIKYAAENITLGITIQNKTKEVADYLSDLMRYGQSGSLYEVMHEIDSLISSGLPSNLAPFVTETRLVSFKNEIQNFLSN
jgi:hypothetical protein